MPLFIATFVFEQALGDGLDLKVYWAAAKEFTSGGQLYAPGLPGTPYGGMAFTYPPFAAAILSPMAFLPVQFALVLQTVANLVIAGVIGSVITAYLVLKGVVKAPSGRVQFVITAVFITGLLLLAGPWRNSLALGQINPLIMGLIVVDLLVATPRHPRGYFPRGMLTGIAAGIKLTPLVFLLYFIFRGDLKSAARMAGTFAATVALMVLVAPSVSLQYWTSALQDTNRVGTLTRFENVSLRGFLARLDIDPGSANLAWILGSLVVLALNAAVVYRFRGQDDQWMAVSATALVMLLVSPVSWGHHWVWVAVIVPALIGRYAQTCTGEVQWQQFIRSWPGTLAVLMTASFALQPPEAATLSGSPHPYAAISTFSEVVVESGIFVAVIVLACFGTLKNDAQRTGSPASNTPVDVVP